MVKIQSVADRLRITTARRPVNDREPRRVVKLTGFGVLDDSTTFSFAVIDLSYNGCMVETAIALFPGVKLRVSMLGLGGVLEATVRWCKNGRAGLQFYPQSEPKLCQTPRQHERMETAAQISVRRRGRPRYQVRLFDLTPKGCKVDFVEHPKSGDLLWVKFDALDAIEATVRWVEGCFGGLEFVRPIYPSVFEMLLAELRENACR